MVITCSLHTNLREFLADFSEFGSFLNGISTHQGSDKKREASLIRITYLGYYGDPFLHSINPER